MSFVGDFGSPADIERRAKTLFHDQRDRIAKSTDRMFALLMAIQWVAGIVAALVVSPIRGDLFARVGACEIRGGSVPYPSKPNGLRTYRGVAGH